MGRRKSRTTDEEWTANAVEMAWLLGAGTKALKDWTMLQGCPVTETNQYRVRAVIRWAIARAAGEGPEEDAAHTQKATTESRTLYYREQTRKITIENERLLRRLITMDEAVEFFQITMQQVTDAFESIPSRIDLPPRDRRRLEQAVQKTRLDLVEDLDSAFGAMDEDPIDTDAAAG